MRPVRDWFPTPSPHGGYNLIRWVSLEGNRLAGAGAILTTVSPYLLAIGVVWTSDMQVILSETSTIENTLDTVMGGKILLVSIAVAINAVVLSRDIAFVQERAEQTRGTRTFRDDIGVMTESGQSPSAPRASHRLTLELQSPRAPTVSVSVPSEMSILIDNSGSEQITEALGAIVLSDLPAIRRVILLVGCDPGSDRCATAPNRCQPAQSTSENPDLLHPLHPR